MCDGDNLLFKITMVHIGEIGIATVRFLAELEQFGSAKTATM